jgi:hypothetical protein
MFTGFFIALLPEKGCRKQKRLHIFPYRKSVSFNPLNQTNEQGVQFFHQRPENTRELSFGVIVMV